MAFLGGVAAAWLLHRLARLRQRVTGWALPVLWPSLVLIIGLLDVLGAIHTTIKDPAWGNVATEGYVFGALVFFVFCFGMSRYSQALERKLDAGRRR